MNVRGEASDRVLPSGEQTQPLLPASVEPSVRAGTSTEKVARSVGSLIGLQLCAESLCRGTKPRKPGGAERGRAFGPRFPTKDCSPPWPGLVAGVLSSP